MIAHIPEMGRKFKPQPNKGEVLKEQIILSWREIKNEKYALALERHRTVLRSSNLV